MLSFVYRNKKYTVEPLIDYSWEQAQARCNEVTHGNLWSISDDDELYAVLEHYLKYLRSRRPENTDEVHIRFSDENYGKLQIRVMYIGLKNNQVKNGVSDFVCLLQCMNV